MRARSPHTFRALCLSFDYAANQEAKAMETVQTLFPGLEHSLYRSAGSALLGHQLQDVHLALQGMEPQTSVKPLFFGCSHNKPVDVASIQR